MTDLKRIAALNVLATYASHEPSHARTVRCSELLEVLNNDADNFWEKFYEVASANGGLDA
jgi:hypothetical protein